MSVITILGWCQQYEAHHHQNGAYRRSHRLAILGNAQLCINCLKDNHRERHSRTCHRCKTFVRDVPIRVFRISATRRKVAICQRCIDEAVAALMSAEIMDAL